MSVVVKLSIYVHYNADVWAFVVFGRLVFILDLFFYLIP